jgi:hypothetical protein
METWKSIPGWEGYYEVSDQGNVRTVTRTVEVRGSLRRYQSTPLKPQKHTAGYLKYTFWRNGVPTNMFTHFAVMSAFSGPRPEGMQICHCNGNKADNRLENLRWDTPSSNQSDRELHGTGRIGKPKLFRKMNAARASEIRRATELFDLNITQTAKLLSLPRTTVADVLNQRTWKERNR